MQMLRRVEDQRRIENSEAERREDLNEEQRSRSLRSRGEKTLGRSHPGFLCCSMRELMSSGASDVSRVATHLLRLQRRFCSGRRAACGISELQPTRLPLQSHK